MRSSFITTHISQEFLSLFLFLSLLAGSLSHLASEYAVLQTGSHVLGGSWIVDLWEDSLSVWFADRIFTSPLPSSDFLFQFFQDIPNFQILVDMFGFCRLVMEGTIIFYPGVLTIRDLHDHVVTALNQQYSLSHQSFDDFGLGPFMKNSIIQK